MKATITKTREISSGQRRKPGRNLVYIKSPFDDVADNFACKYDIFNLEFKCKTWSKVCRLATKAAIKALKEVFPYASDIKFSAKAGCTCGCSPGYVIKENSNVIGKNYWVTIEATDEEISSFKDQVHSPRIVSELELEVLTANLARGLNERPTELC
jgi:hypothetical protein